jgi:2-desacetyl-2-hydroxyethyl bacteriochlorophyllide A dehydrogenase
MEFPHVPGYQAAGIVLEIGADVKNLQSGDRVFSRNCKAPPDWEGSWWGGHVRYHIADKEAVIKLPDNVNTFEAAGLLLAQVGYNGATKPVVNPGDVAIVIGEGLVGQYAAQVLRHRGAYVIISGLFKNRLDLAAKYSADEVYDNSNFDFREYIRKRYPDGVAIALETASRNKTVRETIDLLKRHGQLILNGFYPYPDESRLDWHWLRRKEITVYCPDSRNRARLESTMKLIAQGHMKIKELVTDRTKLEKAPEAYQMLLEPEAEFLGIVIDWK